ncbi:unnamed protein product [Linum trigynum]|uniref:Uncharacterized protein n=1 Tax=Linum trigynum TaxID=586398 RepID=A0AAV2DX79_9ROSI
MGKTVGRSGVVGRRPGEPAAHGRESANPPRPENCDVHPVAVAARRRRLLLEDESEDELSPLFASLGGTDREVERKPVGRGLENMASHDMNMESDMLDQLKSHNLAETMKLAKASSRRSGPDKAGGKNKKGHGLETRAKRQIGSHRRRRPLIVENGWTFL